MDWSMVVHCPVSVLQERLNRIEGNWTPMVWNFYPGADGQYAVVVFARVQPQMVAPPPSLLRRPS
jgi:hypothetical protein